MLLLLGALVSLLISVLQICAFTRTRTVGSCIRAILKNCFIITFLSLFLFRFLLGYPHFLKTDGYSKWVFLGFLGVSLLAGLVVLLLHAIVNKYLTFEEVSRKQTPGLIALRVLSVFLVFVGFLVFFLTIWAKNEYGDLPMDHILITFLSPAEGGSVVDYITALEGPVFYAVGLTFLYTLFLFSKFRLIYLSTHKPLLGNLGHRVVCILLTGIIFFGSLTYGFVRFRLDSIYRAYAVRSTVIDDTFADPRQANLRFPQQKRNLIHIYLESMENSFMDQEHGGFMDRNLIPELTELAEEGYSFSHTDHPFGGPEPVVGTTWSVASMVNMSTGLPMKVPVKLDAYNDPDSFLPGACTLGDLLAQQGYEQTLMFGADADFGGLSSYFRSHGDFKIMDLQYARRNGMIPSDYFVWWGYEDDKLFPFAMDELTRLSQTGKPFHFMMETADTHRPDGYLSSLAPTPYENQYANVLSYSSSEAVKFIRWIQAQPFYENTTIIITGDHLSMETNFFEFYHFDPNYRRSQYNLILNPYPGTVSDDPSIFFNREYANFDFFPTILTAMGVTYDGNRLGIGTDLFSGQPTLLEEMGLSALNHELQKDSKFYDRHILR